MLSRHYLAAAAACSLLALFPAPAQAQIYAWRDASGTHVLSDRPKDPSAKTYAVARSAAVRVTRPAGRRHTSAYEDLIVEHATRQGVEPDLVRAVIQAESAFNPNARSSKGAMGLMQLMPATAAEYGVIDPYDPTDNIRGGVAYLKSLLTRYDDRVELALAAYNAGPGAVERYGGTIPPYRETMDYVDRIQGTMGRSAGAPAPFRLYRSVEIVDGHEVVKYSNVASPGAEIVGRKSHQE
jgi:soluble lytic murein transglycosylase-like protein